MASATGNNSGKKSSGSGQDGRNRAKNPFNTGSSSDSAASSAMDGNTLASLINGEVIPRLMVAHSSDERRTLRGRDDSQSQIKPADAARFAPLPLACDADELLKEVEVYLDQGVSAESVLVDLLAPSARRLGQLWETDSCDFLDVTMGLWRLQEVMREIARITPSVTSARANPPCALFTPLPGETHSFGALMVEEVFARAGWRSEVLLEPTRRELLQIVADHPFDLVGLTVSCDCHSAKMNELITAIRSVSKSPTTKVFIGGRMVNAHPELVEQCGADGTAPDAISALALAERIITESRVRSSFNL